MSRVTAAFVCALCDPDNPRPASIMCSNNCGRYVCSVHAMPRKGPGSAMVCLACAEALGVIEKPRPVPTPEVRPLIEIPSEPEPAPAPTPQPVIETRPAEPEVTPITPSPAPSYSAPAPAAEPIGSQMTTEEVTIVTHETVSPPPPEAVVIEHTISQEAPRAARRLSDTEPALKSAASETVVSQRGNTLQVPKVSSTLGKPPQPIAPKPRKAQRTIDEEGRNIDWKLIGLIAGTIALGVLGFVLILAALGS